jgi:beta-alanine--pyruvate transaminase
MPTSVQPISLGTHWMPFTPNRDFKNDPKLVARAEGMYYWTPDGKKVLDGSSGLFTSAAGHCRKEIAEAVHRQLLELDYTPSFQRGHPKAFQLAEKVAGLLPTGINRVFFVNSGSEAVDTAMKMCLAYHRVRGEGQRTLFVSRERAYHGVNFGGVALSGMVKNRQAFGFGLPPVAHMRQTWTPEQRFTKGSPARPACWCRPRAIWSGCASSATSTAFSWCSMRSSAASGERARRSGRRAST